MRIMATGDWHLTHLKPRCRKDTNYLQTQFNKVLSIINLFAENECDTLVQTGDVFDSFKAPDLLKRLYIELFLNYNMKFYAVAGQHDKYFHSSDMDNIPLAVLKAAEIVKIASKVPFVYPAQKIILYGASFGEDIPEVPQSDMYKILILHKLILKEHASWEGKTDFLFGNILLGTTNYDLILSGDNHQTFEIEGSSSMLLNPGSLMRSTVDQINHLPCVYIIDTVTRQYKKLFLPVLPAHEVIDITKAEEEKQRSQELEEFIAELEKFKELPGMDFLRNLNEFTRNNAISQGITSVIEEALNEIRASKTGIE